METAEWGNSSEGKSRNQFDFIYLFIDAQKDECGIFSELLFGSRNLGTVLVTYGHKMGVRNAALKLRNFINCLDFPL